MDSQITAKTHTESNLRDTEAEMAMYGIKKVPVDYFHYQGFRYTNLKDAIAQAKRDGLDAEAT